VIDFLERLVSENVEWNFKLFSELGNSEKTVFDVHLIRVDSPVALLIC